MVLYISLYSSRTDCLSRTWPHGAAPGLQPGAKRTVSYETTLYIPLSEIESITLRSLLSYSILILSATGAITNTLHGYSIVLGLSLFYIALQTLSRDIAVREADRRRNGGIEELGNDKIQNRNYLVQWVQWYCVFANVARTKIQTKRFYFHHWTLADTGTME